VAGRYLGGFLPSLVSRREAVLKFDVALYRKELNAQGEILLSRVGSEHGRDFIC
jgi:hypothetical protein